MKLIKKYILISISTTNLLTAYSGSATITKSTSEGQATASISGSGSRGYGTVNLYPDNSGSIGYTANGSITLTSPINLPDGYTKETEVYSPAQPICGPEGCYEIPAKTTETQSSTISAGTYTFDNTDIAGVYGPGENTWYPPGENLTVYGSPTGATLYYESSTHPYGSIGYTTGGYASGDYTSQDSVLYMYNSDGIAVPVAYVDYNGNGTATLYWNTQGVTVPQ